jgi:hypothetical protein
MMSPCLIRVHPSALFRVLPQIEFGHSASIRKFKNAREHASEPTATTLTPVKTPASARLQSMVTLAGRSPVSNAKVETRSRSLECPAGAEWRVVIVPQSRPPTERLRNDQIFTAPFGAPPALGGQLKTGNLWTVQNRQFPLAETMSSTSFPRRCANQSALWSASFEARI